MNINQDLLRTLIAIYCYPIFLRMESDPSADLDIDDAAYRAVEAADRLIAALADAAADDAVVEDEFDSLD